MASFMNLLFTKAVEHSSELAKSAAEAMSSFVSKVAHVADSEFGVEASIGQVRQFSQIVKETLHHRG